MALGCVASNSTTSVKPCLAARCAAVESRCSSASTSAPPIIQQHLDYFQFTILCRQMQGRALVLALAFTSMFSYPRTSFNLAVARHRGICKCRDLSTSYTLS